MRREVGGVEVCGPKAGAPRYALDKKCAIRHERLPFPAECQPFWRLRSLHMFGEGPSGFRGGLTATKILHHHRRCPGDDHTELSLADLVVNGAFTSRR